MPEFSGKLRRVALVRWVELPRRRIEALNLPRAAIRGGGLGLNALLRFNGDIDRVTLLPGRPGYFKLAIKVELLRAAGVDAGSTITFSLEPDTASREPDLPDAMRQAFQARPHLVPRWAAHSVATRRQVVRYIEQARSPEVRAKRAWLFVERLAETGRLGA